MFEHGTINITQQLSGFSDQHVLDANLTYYVRVYAFKGEEMKSVKEALRTAVISDLEINQEKLDLVADIPIEDLRSIKQCYLTGDLYDSFGRAWFTRNQS